MGVRPLRGRVAVRPIVETRTGLIWHPDQRPDTERSEDKQLGKLAQSSHRGIVLAAGAPAIKYGFEVPLGFSVGDEVVYVFAAGGTEESRRSLWGEEACVWVAQEEVIAVVEVAA
jgi:co-chaperonin GroES (HSP10)